MFIRFALVGALAFLVDWIAVTVFLRLGLPFFIARAFSYVCAATFAWICNRIFTFRSDSKSYLAQWIRYLGANALGGGVNYAVSVLLSLLLSGLVDRFPVVAIATGTLCGMLFNFILSKRFVFVERD